MQNCVYTYGKWVSCFIVLSGSGGSCLVQPLVQITVGADGKWSKCTWMNPCGTSRIQHDQDWPYLIYPDLQINQLKLRGLSLVVDKLIIWLADFWHVSYWKLLQLVFATLFGCCFNTPSATFDDHPRGCQDMAGIHGVEAILDGPLPAFQARHRVASEGRPDHGRETRA